MPGQTQPWRASTLWARASVPDLGLGPGAVHGHGIPGP